jgi:hypothetical protein
LNQELAAARFLSRLLRLIKIFKACEDFLSFFAFLKQKYEANLEAQNVNKKCWEIKSRWRYL